jgi:hypothetical protein
VIATITGTSPKTVTLTGPANGWSANVNYCGHANFTISVGCSDGVYTLFMSSADGCINFGGVNNWTATSVACSPFQVTFPNISASDTCGTCGANWTIQVTVTL